MIILEIYLKKTADLKKKIDVENGTSVAKFNKSYQELDKMCNTEDYFSDMTDAYFIRCRKLLVMPASLKIRTNLQ